MISKRIVNMKKIFLLLTLLFSNFANFALATTNYNCVNSTDKIVGDGNPCNPGGSPERYTDFIATDDEGHQWKVSYFTRSDQAPCGPTIAEIASASIGLEYTYDYSNSPVCTADGKTTSNTTAILTCRYTISNGKDSFKVNMTPTTQGDDGMTGTNCSPCSNNVSMPLFLALVANILVTSMMFYTDKNRVGKKYRVLYSGVY